MRRLLAPRMAKIEITTQPNEPRSMAQAPRVWIHWVWPPEVRGRGVELTWGLVLGREETLADDGPGAPTAYGCVPHATVSRRHAAVEVGFGVPILKDLGSSNGTHVNGRVIREPTPIPAQSVVRLGDALGVVEQRSEGTRESAAVPGVGPLMDRVRTVLEHAAPETGAVLVLGETGTGKEWLAAEVHRLSGRRGPYQKLSCAELSPQLVESQLFGHERGAFTGAVARHVGLFQSAHEGTLFLDEVGELPLELQAKLLRVLQEGEVRSVGSVQTYRTDVRVVSATNRNLAEAVEAGTFRRDLYARLSVFELALPPLRERRQDILAWLDRLWQRACQARQRAATFELHPVAAERIVNHAWPDNLRGLDRLVQRLVAMGDRISVGAGLLGELMPELSDAALSGSVAPAADVPAKGRQTPAPRGATGTDPPAVVDPTRDEFLAVYEGTGRSVRATSLHFGRDRRQIYRWLKAFGIER
jgi:DNA-binding NtrC family response regulator